MGSMESRVSVNSEERILGKYLKDIRKTDLLTRSGEYELCCRIERDREKIRELERCVDALQAKGSGSSKARTRLQARLRRQKRALRLHRTRFIEANLLLVAFLAMKQRRPSGHSLLDLIQEGNLGLYKALRRFDPHKGFKFSTYATWWIRLYISRAIRRDRLVKGPPPGTAGQSGAEMPSAREPAESDAFTGPRNPVIIPWDVQEESRRAIDESTAGTAEDTPHEALIHREISTRLSGALDALSPRERTIITMSYGLGEHRAQSLSAIGRIMGVSQQRVHQLRTRAFTKLKGLDAVRDAASLAGIASDRGEGASSQPPRSTENRCAACAP